MQPTQPTWGRYQELRPDELADCIKATPIAFWPLRPYRTSRVAFACWI